MNKPRGNTTYWDNHYCVVYTHNQKIPHSYTDKGSVYYYTDENGVEVMIEDDYGTDYTCVDGYLDDVGYQGEFFWSYYSEQDHATTLLCRKVPTLQRDETDNANVILKKLRKFGLTKN